MLQVWDQRARDQGRGPDWRWSDEQLEATRIALLGPPEREHDLWIFGYGSLMWDPGFPHRRHAPALTVRTRGQALRARVG